MNLDTLRLSAHLTTVFCTAIRWINGDERLVVLNSTAHNIVRAQLGKNTDHVFSYRGEQNLSKSTETPLNQQPVLLDYYKNIYEHYRSF